jgi:hypothetical protein
MVGLPGAAQDRLPASRRILSLAVLGFRGEGAKEADLLVLRHETQCCVATPPESGTSQPTRCGSPRWHDFLPRGRWIKVFPVTPATLLAWHSVPDSERDVPRHPDRHRDTTDPPKTCPQRPDQQIHARRPRAEDLQATSRIPFSSAGGCRCPESSQQRQLNRTADDCELIVRGQCADQPCLGALRISRVGSPAGTELGG